MFKEPNRKIVGAFVVGLALVGGAYTVSNFGQPRMQMPAAVAVSAPARVAIEVTDKDSNGIEDWRDSFVTTEPIIIERATTTPYEPPTTLTGQIGINFFENVIRAKNYGPFGKTQEQVIEQTVNVLAQETAHDLYDTSDISIIQNWTEADIKNYANAMGGAIVNNGSGPGENELLILDDVINRGKTERMNELVNISKGYGSLRDTALATPVPAILAKQHLDVINTYHAMNADIDGMTKSVSDPAYALMRIKRYENDALGLKLAMENMYRALEPYSGLFTSNDPATFFANFAPNNQPPAQY